MEKTPFRRWAISLTLPEAMARFPLTWSSDIIRETVWKWLQVGKLVAVAEKLTQRNWSPQEYVRLDSEQWNHMRPDANAAFWINGDVDLLIDPTHDPYSELDDDAWSASTGDVARLIGVRIDPDSIPFQERPANSTTAQTRAMPTRGAARWWPAFAEELAIYIHEEGIPDGIGTDGQGDLIKVIQQRVANRNIDEPSRTAIQPVIQAVLDRLRATTK